MASLLGKASLIAYTVVAYDFGRSRHRRAQISRRAAEKSVSMIHLGNATTEIAKASFLDDGLGDGATVC